MRRLLAVFVLCGCAGSRAVVPASPEFAARAERPAATTKLFKLQTPNAGGLNIAAGSDGALWFTEELASRIGRITTGGKQTSYKTLAPNASPLDITAGPDKSLWFTEYAGARIGRITTAGKVTEFKVPHVPTGITAGPDGALWFLEIDGTTNYVARMTPKGKVTEYKLRSHNGFSNEFITKGPAKTLWFTQPSTNQVGSITLSGTVKLYKNTDGDARPEGIVAIGSSLWVGESDGVAKVSTGGTFTEFPMPPGGGGAVTGITRGADGKVWFAVGESSQIGTISGGKVKLYQTGPLQPMIQGLTLGGDGNLWFVQSTKNAIGRFTF